MAMETSSSRRVFAADKVDAATAPVKEEGPSAECKSFISRSLPVALLLWGLQFRPINRQRLFKHSQLHLGSIHRTRMRTQVSSTMNSWQNIKSDSRLAQLQTLAYFALMGLVFHLVTYHRRLLMTASACGDAGHGQRW
jgi:hypothetical protein